MVHTGDMTTNTTIAALASIELFTGLSKKELAAIDRLMTPIDIKAGKEVIKEGTAGREAFIIVEGTASVWREGRLIASVGSGAVLGEVALLANRTRTATVKAETAMTVEVLSVASLSNCSIRVPPLHASSSLPLRNGSTNSNPRC